MHDSDPLCGNDHAASCIVIQGTNSFTPTSIVPARLFKIHFTQPIYTRLICADLCRADKAMITTCARKHIPDSN